ncbi:hypothetical protein VTL71DRAFT_8352 [Oculimacula yallundae]|uniref:Uncharacterized protein n=1 Tax=Oculimacula yallundae TaxID=86028 RepID=A0ABR4CXD2_9HELO
MGQKAKAPSSSDLTLEIFHSENHNPAHPFFPSHKTYSTSSSSICGICDKSAPSASLQQRPALDTEISALAPISVFGPDKRDANKLTRQSRPYISSPPPSQQTKQITTSTSATTTPPTSP